MDRSCHCCAYHGHHHAWNNGRRAWRTDRGLSRESPSPIWPLVVLCLVFVLLMGPLIVEPPEENMGSGFKLLCLMLPFLFLLGFQQFCAHSDQRRHNAFHNSYSYAYTEPSDGAEEPLHGWCLFLLFVVAVVLFPFSRS